MKRRTSLKFSQISFILAITLLPLSQAQANEASAEPLPQGLVQLPDFSPVVDKVKNAVVNVTTTQMVKANPTDMLREFFGFGFGGPGMGGPQMEEPRRQMRPAQALGTGFVIDPDGYIVTNNHVVEDAKEIKVTFQDGSKINAKIIGQDKDTDLALLKVETKKKLQVIEWGDSDKLKVGNWVLAFGYPFRLGLTMTKGVVSALGRNIGGGPFDDFIQTDAPINVGNSGGPLVNASTAQIIGINTAILSPSGASAGIGFAIPSSTARPIIEKLKAGGKVQRGSIGVAIDKLRDDVGKSLGLKEDVGALVVNVQDESPAKEAGVKPGDVILSFNGHEIKDDSGLVKAVANTDIGKTVEMKVWRSNESGVGAEVTLKIKVGDRTKIFGDGKHDVEGTQGKQDKKSNVLTIDVLGLTFSPITPALKEKYGISKKISGVVIVDMDPMSPARGRLKVGDVITKVGQKPVTSAKDIENAIAENRKADKSVLLLWANRSGSENFITLPIPEDMGVDENEKKAE